jgi:peptidyl-prolyl cis-trans isomerase SurA
VRLPKISALLLAGTALLATLPSSAAEPVTGPYLDRVRAVVGDKPVLDSEVKEFLGRIRQSPALAGIFHVDPKTFSEEAALNRLIEERIVSQAVKELDAPVTDTEVDTQIAGILKQNGISLKQMQASLAHEGVPFDAYRNNIRSQLERRNVFDRELRGGSGGVTESELRAYYDSRAPTEVHLHVISANPAKLSKILAEIRAKGLKGEAIRKAYAAEDVGWVSADSLDPAVAKELESVGIDEIIGPIRLSGTPKLVYVEGRRKGSDEDFQRSKGNLAQEARLNDSERRFAAWLERKKSEMQIIVNR